MKNLLTVIMLLLSVTLLGQTKTFKITNQNNETVDYKLTITKKGFGAPVLTGLDLGIEGDLFLTKISNEKWYIQANSRYVVEINYETKTITVTLNGKIKYNLIYSNYKEKK